MLGMERTAVLAGEHQTGVPPRPSPSPSLVVLLGPPQAQYADRPGVEVDGAGATVRFRVADLGRPPELHDLLADTEETDVEVDVLPAQANRLAAAQPSVGDQVEQRVE